MTGKIQITQPKGAPTPPNTWDDFKWASQNKSKLYERFGAGVVLVYNRQIVGSGKTLDEAEADAESAYMGQDVITPVIFFVPRPGVRIGTLRAIPEAERLHDSD